jgi:nitronate monooxygenase
LNPENQSHKAWKDVWSAGQGVGTIDDVPSVQDLVSRMTSEYEEAVSSLS